MRRHSFAMKRLKKNVRMLIITKKLAIERFENLDKEEKQKIKEKMLENKFFRQSFQKILKSKKEEPSKNSMMTFNQFIEGVLEKMKIKTYQKGDFLCHEGEIGNEMFLVYSGNVGVYLPKDKKLREKNKKVLFTEDNVKEKFFFDKTQKILAILKENDEYNQEILCLLTRLDEVRKSVDCESWDTKNLYLLTSPMRRKYYEDLVIKYFHVANKIAGHIVGEMALINNAPRNATLMALLKTKCLTLDREAYNEYFNYLIKDQGDKQNFFARCFPTLSRKKLSTFAYMFLEKRYNRGETLATKGNFIDKMLIIKEGDVGVSSKNLENHHNGKGKINLHNGRETIAILKKFCLVGEEGFYKKNYNFTFVALSQPVVTYVLEAKNFEKSKKMISNIIDEVVKLSMKSLKYRKKRKKQIDRFYKGFLRRKSTELGKYKKVFEKLKKKEKKANDLFLKREQEKKLTESGSMEMIKTPKRTIFPKKKFHESSSEDSDREPSIPIEQDYKLKFVPYHVRKVKMEQKKTFLDEIKNVNEMRLRMISDLKSTGREKQSIIKSKSRQRKKLKHPPDYIKRDKSRPIVKIKKFKKPYLGINDKCPMKINSICSSPVSNQALMMNPLTASTNLKHNFFGEFSSVNVTKGDRRRATLSSNIRRFKKKEKKNKRAKSRDLRGHFKLMQLELKEKSNKLLHKLKNEEIWTKDKTQVSVRTLKNEKNIFHRHYKSGRRALQSQVFSPSAIKLGLIGEEQKRSSLDGFSLKFKPEKKSKRRKKILITNRKSDPFSRSESYHKTHKYQNQHPMRGQNRFRKLRNPTIPLYKDFFSRRSVPLKSHKNRVQSQDSMLKYNLK